MRNLLTAGRLPPVAIVEHFDVLELDGDRFLFRAVDEERANGRHFPHGSQIRTLEDGIFRVSGNAVGS